ncbi:hypothetical protein GMST_32830 [Geomonas silvestris]|uniref:DNA-binding protein n=1 Tax=Geomonas silvestris TaxID=2740184 RepID=A0A6V8MLS4_9BACT|nr:hypothetical protein [Geomonas silvestris]GFO60958.1 hypothetical protein GMST_32830 [Geomonas silvestris]
MDLNLKSMAERWPSAIVARNEVDRFTGGVISPRSLANLDSLGLGPEGAFRIGRKVAYPVAAFIDWLEGRASLRRAA